MGLLYPPPLLVPPYLPSINATAGASCNNTCTSEPPARQRETAEGDGRGAGEGGPGRMDAEGKKEKDVEGGSGRERKKQLKRWWDGVMRHVRRPAM